MDEYQELIQTLCTLKNFRIPKEIEISRINLDFRQKIYQMVNCSISAKMGLIMDDLSCKFSLDDSKNFKKQVYEVCLWAINSSNTLVAAIGIQKAMQAHGSGFSQNIQEYLLGFLLDSNSGDKAGNLFL